MGMNFISNNKLGSDFWHKSMPVLTVGFIIWIFTSIILGLTKDLLNFIILSFIIFLVIYLVLGIFTYYLAHEQKNKMSMCCFFLSAFMMGVLTSPIYMVLSLLFGQMVALIIFLMILIIAIMSTIGLLILGMRLGEKIKEAWRYTLILFFVELIILGFLSWDLMVISGINNLFIFLISFGIDILLLLSIFALIIYDGSRLSKTIMEGKWMECVIDIFLDIINVFLLLMDMILECLDALS